MNYLRFKKKNEKYMKRNYFAIFVPILLLIVGILISKLFLFNTKPIINKETDKPKIYKIFEVEIPKENKILVKFAETLTYETFANKYIKIEGQFGTHQWGEIINVNEFKNFKYNSVLIEEKLWDEYCTKEFYKSY